MIPFFIRNLYYTVCIPIFLFSHFPLFLPPFFHIYRFVYSLAEPQPTRQLPFHQIKCQLMDKLLMVLTPGKAKEKALRLTC